MRLFLIMLIFLCQSAFAQVNWNAEWISHPDAPPNGFGVYHFRKNIDLESVPGAAVLHVSADNRYRLFVNGTSVCYGPQRGDVEHWRYESVDVAPYLVEGQNTIAAQVHNAGPDYPMAQTSDRTGFILQSDDLGIATGTDWKVLQNSAYDPITLTEMAWWKWADGWYACGFTDQLNAEDYPWGWQQTTYDDSEWQNAVSVTGNWRLEERKIPFMEETLERFAAVRRTRGVEVDDAFLSGNSPITIPARTTFTLLLDMGQESVGFPELLLSGGKGTRIKITYAESLVDADGNKGDRNKVEGKNIRGYWDTYIAGGGENRLFRPLWLRTFRYVQIKLRTRTEPLTIHDYVQVFSAYPLKQNASFTSDDPTLKRIWDVAWRTMRCCALETYTDCPYYEQLNYPGDTRVQAHLSLYLSGDDRLMRDAIRVVSYSQMSNGLTQAAYPIRKGDEIKIPTYALYWISMLHDYYLLRNDGAFIEQYLPITRDILDWFENHVDDTGLLYALDMWNFVDWAFTKGTPNGAIRDEKGHSGFVSLQFAYTLDQAAELMSHFGYNEEAQQYLDRSATLKQAVVSNCFNDEKKLFADSPEMKNYSQHTNIFAILTDAIPAADQPALMQRILDDKSLTQCTSYFSFYLFRAMQKTGKAGQFLNHLGLWTKMLGWGLTTFGESGRDHNRSDCHAWSAHPAYYFLSLVCGIMPAEPGFESVAIQPSLGSLNEIIGTMPHPKGDIVVDLKRADDGGLNGSVQLPAGLTGTFKWNGTTIDLPAGTTAIEARDTSVGDNNLLPGETKLGQNYPNPFNPSTVIPYSVGHTSDISLAVYNVHGQHITTLAEGRHDEGEHTVIWDGTNTANRQVAAGVYWIQLKAGDYCQSKKISFVR